MTTTEARKALQERRNELEKANQALSEKVDMTVDAGRAAVHKKYNIRWVVAIILIILGIVTITVGVGVMFILIGGVIIYRNVNVHSFEVSKIDQSYESARRATRESLKI